MCDSSPFAKISSRVLRPLVGLCKQHAIREFRIDVSAKFLKIFMRLGQILAVRVFPFVKVRDGIEPKPVHTHRQPEIADLLHGIVHGRIIKIQVRLMRIKPMPVVGFRERVPRPVRCFEIFEDDSRVLVFFRRVAPDIEVLVSEVSSL